MKRLPAATIQTFLFVVSFISIGILLLSLVYSGIPYMIDNDELFHTQLTYLIAHGYKPYDTLYVTVYTPLFQWILLPLFHTFGFSFSTMTLARYMMFGFYLIRLALLFLIGKKLFGLKAGIIAVFLHLFDPFTNLSALQIRSDNAMILSFLAGVYFFISSWDNKGIFGRLLAGIFLSLSALILLKIAPAVAIFLGLGTLALLWTRRFYEAGTLFIGSLLPPILFSLYFAISGRFGEMVMQTIIESVSSYSKFPIPVAMGFFFFPNNNIIFGLPGKPLNWIYAWVLPLLSSGGIWFVLQHVVQTKHWKHAHILMATLATATTAQWLFLFTMTSIFLQHFIPTNTLFCLFGGYALATLVDSATNAKVRIGIITLLVVLGGLLGHTTIRANYARGTNTGTDVISFHKQVWSIIPEDAKVFPNFLFRPLAFPIPYAHYIGNVPDEILNRLPHIEDSLEKHTVQYLILDEWHMRYITPPTLAYIEAHYTKDSRLNGLWIRK